MSFYPAHCDHDCNGCSQNNGCGWCIFLDIPIGGYTNTTFSNLATSYIDSISEKED